LATLVLAAIWLVVSAAVVIWAWRVVVWMRTATHGARFALPACRLLTSLPTGPYQWLDRSNTLNFWGAIRRGPSEYETAI
jgi:hypothetical protein